MCNRRLSIGLWRGNRDVYLRYDILCYDRRPKYANALVVAGIFCCQGCRRGLLNEVLLKPWPNFIIYGAEISNEYSGDNVHGVIFRSA
jgi:hypothetical protein